MLVPYNRKNHSVYNPFQDFDDLERAFFSDRSLGELKTDIKDTGDSYTLEADLPGFKKEDISIDIEDNYLTITAARHSEYEKKDKKGNYIRCERSYGNFSRSFDLTGIDTEGLSATFADGVLTLKMPKLVETKPAAKKLEIQ